MLNIMVYYVVSTWPIVIIQSRFQISIFSTKILIFRIWVLKLQFTDQSLGQTWRTGTYWRKPLLGLSSCMIPKSVLFARLNVSRQIIQISRLGQYLNLLFIYRVTPQRMRLQRRVNRIYTVCFRTFLTACNCELVYFFVKSINRQEKDYILTQLDLTLKSSYYKSFRSSLRSHPLWVTGLNRKLVK